MKERIEHIKECLSLLRQKLKCFEEALSNIEDPKVQRELEYRINEEVLPTISQYEKELNKLLGKI